MSTQAFQTELAANIRAEISHRRPRPAAVPARLMPLPGIRAVLFDVYGTLFASATGDIGVGGDADARVMRVALQAAGVKSRDAAAGLRGVVLLESGIRRSHALGRARGVRHPEVEIRTIWRGVLRALAREGLVAGEVGAAKVAKLAVAYECRSNAVGPMPGLRDTLAMLRRRGVRMGLVSNAQFYTPLLFPAMLDKSLGELGIEPALCVWSYRLGEAKPSARLWAEALRRLRVQHGVRPVEVLAVGNDLIKDVAPAAQLGCRTAWFVGDARAARPWPPPVGPGAPRADVVLTSLSALRQVVCPFART